MDKPKQLGLLKQALDEIAYLRTLPYKNGEFGAWKNKVTHILEMDYGSDSPELRRFLNAPGKSFVVGTELGREQEYQRQLDCYEGALKSIVG